MRLGPFELVAPLAEGTASRVWRGRHVEQGVDVAVKVLHGPVDARRLAAFRREVRAVARLYHPAVVQILDFGVETDDGALPAGTPWMVLPLARGSLATWWWSPRWDEVQALLERVLRALAHAHARGVIHRDLKPANLLVTDVDPPGGVRLSDFGVAILADEPGGPRVAGTLRYMAPEQLRGELARVGPWTDLYALGILAWELVAGAQPFAGSPDDETLRLRHLSERPPRLEPRFAVPDGLEGWLCRLLEKGVTARYACAADALAALAALGPADRPASGAGAPVPARSDPTLTFDSLDLDTLDFDREPEPAVVRAELPPAALPVPVVAAEAPPELPMPLVGAGLRLWALRDRPLVGRDEERQRLVLALGRVTSERRTRFVLLGGPTGVGKSRLARWLVEWAVEHGQARAYTVLHGLGRSAADGVDGLLAALDLPLDGPATARWERIRCALAAEALARPVVLWLDDVPHGEDALGLARHLAVCDAVEPVPLLVVMTAEREELAASSVALAALARLEVERLELDVLPPADRALLTQVLRLRPGRDALRIEVASGGSPMIAVRLVEHALATGALVAGPHGLELSADAALPAELNALWGERVRAAAGAGVAAVAVAGVLGPAVALAEWRATCLEAGVEPDRAGLDALVQAGMLVEEEHGWRFVHELARAAAEALAAAPARLHRAASGAVDAPWRRARHLLAAGDDEAAIAPLLESVRLLGEQGRLAEAQSLHDRARDALDRATAPPGDVRRGRLLVLEGGLWFRLGRTDRARGVVLALAAGRTAHGWPEVEPGAEYLAGDLALLEGRLGDAEAHLARSLAASLREGDAPRARGARMRRSHVWVMQGRLDEAAAGLEAAIAEADRANATVGASVGCSWRSQVAYQQGDAAGASRWGEEALARARRVGEQGALAHASCIVGNARFLAGDVPGAIEAWAESARRYDAIGSPQAAVARVNLGTQRWRDGDRRGAERELSAAREVFGRLGQRRHELDAALRLAAASLDPELRASVLAEAELEEDLDSSAREFLAEWARAEPDPRIARLASRPAIELTPRR